MPTLSHIDPIIPISEAQTRILAKSKTFRFASSPSSKFHHYYKHTMCSHSDLKPLSLIIFGVVAVGQKQVVQIPPFCSCYGECPMSFARGQNLMNPRSSIPRLQRGKETKLLRRKFYSTDKQN